MGKRIKLANDYYAIGEDFRLLAFNRTVAERSEGIKLGDYCYKAIMNREQPCLHCPLAGNTDSDSSVYFDQFYNDWVEAVFSEAEEGRYCVTLRQVNKVSLREKENKQEAAMEEQMAIIKGLTADYHLVMIVDYHKDTVRIYRSDGEDDSENHLLRSTENVSVSGDVNFGLEFKNYDETMKKYVEAYVNERDRSRVLKAVALDTVVDKLKGNRVYTVNYRRINAGGSERHNQMAFIRDTEEADSTNIVIAIRDVDDMVKEEKKKHKELKDALTAAEYANISKTTFLNNMSHDMRTPMNAIIGFTSLAIANIDNTEQVKSYLRNIRTSSKQLLSLINYVLDMSRIESGKIKLEEKENSLPEIMHDLCTIIQPDISARGLKLYLDIEDVVYEDVICDRLRLNQILMNIMCNAIKFTRPGDSIRLQLIQKPGFEGKYAEYEFRIKDTGIGMSEEFLGHVFEPFERESTSTISGIEGLGLGMAITKRLVDMMSGWIDVFSEQDKGTEFVVSMCFEVAGDAVKSGIPEIEGKRILVVDEDICASSSICRMLETMGACPVSANSGSEALKVIRKSLEENEEFETYIIDGTLTDMKCPELIHEIRRTEREIKHILVLSVYDWTDKTEIEEYMTTFRVKPLFMSELVSALGKGVQKKNTMIGNDNYYDKFKDKKILLVEDNEINQDIAVAILEETGFIVEVVDNGYLAVERMESALPGQYDLILMDIQMPVMNGYEAARRIRSMENPLLSGIPIIAMTANVLTEDILESKESGMDAHVAKPIDVELLKSTIAGVLDRAS